MHHFATFWTRIKTNILNYFFFFRDIFAELPEWIFRLTYCMRFAPYIYIYIQPQHADHAFLRVSHSSAVRGAARWRARWYVEPLVDVRNIGRKRRKCKPTEREKEREKERRETCWALQGDDAAFCLRQWRRSVIRGECCVRHYAMREPTRDGIPRPTGWPGVLSHRTKH